MANKYLIQRDTGILGATQPSGMTNDTQLGILSESAVDIPKLPAIQPTTPMFVALSGSQAMGMKTEQLQQIADPRNGHPSQGIAGAELARRMGAGKTAGQLTPADAEAIARRLAYAKGKRYPV